MTANSEEAWKTGNLDGLVVHGKTGTGIPRTAGGSLDSAHGVGWFVG